MPPARRLLRVARVLRPLLIAAAIAGVFIAPSAAHATPSVEDLRKQITAKSTKLEAVVEQYNKAREDLKKSKAEAAALEKSMKPLQAQIDAAQERVTAIAVRAYKGGDFAAMSSVLESGSAATAVDRLTTIDRIATSNQREIDAFHAARRDKDARAAKLADLVKSQQKTVDDLAAKRKTITKELDHLYDLRRQAYGSAQETTSTNSNSGGSSAQAPSVSGKAGVAVRFAYGALGKPYVWAADGPGGYDCSGLTLAAWRAAGYSLPHNAAMQYNQLPKISRSQLRAGDLVFYSGLGHVAIYVGNGKVIHSPTFGEVVKVASVDMMSIYGYARVA
ncbi:C40 family peptidase [Luedemannella helvata]|uniref:C40 family peptidase n=1 Tax=Luedemannella helvata TaxID=349315 RepID=A0ABN2KYV6_9ACTN